MDRTPTITRIPLSGTSAYVILGPVPILVDTGMVGQQALLRQKLRHAGVEFKDLALVIITHAHSDHAGCLEWVHASTGAAIACSEETLELLERGAPAAMKPRTVAGRALRPILLRMAGYPAVQGGVAIGDTMTLAPYGVEGCVLPTPGHTRGCVSVLVGEHAIVGDLVAGRLGRARVPSVPMLVEDRAAWSESVRLVLSHGVRRFHPAHGGPFDAERVAALL